MRFTLQKTLFLLNLFGGLENTQTQAKTTRRSVAESMTCACFVIHNLLCEKRLSAYDTPHQLHSYGLRAVFFNSVF